jgi:hypothetical protein
MPGTQSLSNRSLARNNAAYSNFGTRISTFPLASAAKWDLNPPPGRYTLSRLLAPKLSRNHAVISRIIRQKVTGARHSLLQVGCRFRKVRFVHIDGVTRRGSEGRQCLRTARLRASWRRAPRSPFPKPYAIAAGNGCRCRSPRGGASLLLRIRPPLPSSGFLEGEILDPCFDARPPVDIGAVITKALKAAGLMKG